MLFYHIVERASTYLSERTFEAVDWQHILVGSWPVDYQEQLSGSKCILCSEGRPEESGHRIRFYSSATADAYLHTHGVQRGYCVVIWRGRHVVEPTALSDEEAAAFWSDMIRVSRAMQEVYRPLKMNYQLLGNRVAHFHYLGCSTTVPFVSYGAFNTFLAILLVDAPIMMW